MAGAALFRSAAKKIARAPPRLLMQERLQHHGRRLEGPGPSNRLSRYSSSSASTPPPTNGKGSHANNRKVPNEWDWAKAAAIEIVPKIACCFALSSCMFIVFCVNPRLDRIKDNMEAFSVQISATKDEMERSHQRIRALLDSEDSDFEAIVGQGKEQD